MTTSIALVVSDCQRFTAKIVFLSVVKTQPQLSFQLQRQIFAKISIFKLDLQLISFSREKLPPAGLFAGMSARRGNERNSMLVFVLLEVKVNNSQIKYCLKVVTFDILLLQVMIRSYINIVTGFFFFFYARMKCLRTCF